MRFGFLSLPVGFAYMLALYPLDRRATLIKLVGEDKADEALEALRTGAAALLLAPPLRRRGLLLLLRAVSGGDQRVDRVHGAA